MNTRHARVIGMLLILFAVGPVRGVWAGPPSDQLRAGVDRVLTILRDPALKGEKQVVARRAAISKIALEIFDFGEMAKRSLGQHWVPRTAPEREEFVRLFTELIERSYISKVDQHDTVATMTYGKETVDGGYAVVQAAIPLPHGNSIPLGYHMHDTSGRWKVYDLDIDGISLVANYRAQFNKIIRVSSFEDLLAKLKANLAEFAPPSGTSSRSKAAR